MSIIHGRMNKRLPKSELGEVLFAVLIASSLGAILLSLLMQHLVGLLSWQQKLKQQADDQTRALYAITLIAHSLEMAMTLSESPTQHINLLPDSIRAVYDEPSVRITASPDPNLGLTKPGSGSYIRGSPVISIVQGKLPVVQVSILPRQSQFLFEHAKSLFKAGDVVWISNGQITVLDQIISAGEHQVSLLQPVPVALTGAWMMPIERNVFYLGLDALHHSALYTLNREGKRVRREADIKNLAIKVLPASTGSPFQKYQLSISAGGANASWIALQPRG